MEDGKGGNVEAVAGASKGGYEGTGDGGGADGGVRIRETIWRFLLNTNWSKYVISLE